MPATVALRRYLQRHIETGLPACTAKSSCWQHTLVIPAYREPAALLRTLGQLPRGDGRTLVILVLNRPDSDPDHDANTPLRSAIATHSHSGEQADRPLPIPLNSHTDLYLHDMEKLNSPTPARQGVGLARKTGCDIALQWMHAGAISSQWICSTDADATLPRDYFKKLDGAAPDAVAAVFPFRHIPGAGEACDSATALYELRLHHYVLGLEYAGSPYGHHTLGSCLAVRKDAYVQVRGFPKRAGAEDFYLLGKLAKLGPVARLQGDCILLQSRSSNRVPFGTGPAVAAIAAEKLPAQSSLFYHPQCFAALRALLRALPALFRAELTSLPALLMDQGLDQPLARACNTTLSNMGMEAALAHCRRQGKSEQQFLRQFHQWFDAFRTLKFIHGIRAAGWPQQSLVELARLEPRLWPQVEETSPGVEALRESARRHWSWQG